MTLEPTQPRSGTLSAKSSNAKRQPAKGDSGMKGKIGANKIKAPTTTHTKSMPSSNKVNRVRSDVRGQNERGYVKTDRAARESLHNMSAGRIRKIGRK